MDANDAAKQRCARDVARRIRIALDMLAQGKVGLARNEMDVGLKASVELLEPQKQRPRNSSKMRLAQVE